MREQTVIGEPPPSEDKVAKSNEDEDEQPIEDELADDATVTIN